MKKTILMLALIVSVNCILCAQNWSLLGNAGTVDGTNFIGTTDNKPLNFRVNNQKSGRIDPALFNTFFGYYSGASALASSSNNSYFGANSGRLTTSGNNNTAVGFSSLYNNLTGYWNTASGASALFTNTSGHNNTAIGKNSMYGNQTGYDNTATGSYSLQANLNGLYNTANGSVALYLNSNGSRNSAFGAYSLYTNNGNDNTAVGYQASYSNYTASENTAVGYKALFSNTTGPFNTAVGYNALSANLGAALNVAVGWKALQSNTGNSNTAIGSESLLDNTTGVHNTAVGAAALQHNLQGQANVAIGSEALFSNTIGVQNVAVGYYAGRTGLNYSNTISVGYFALVLGSNQARIGNTSITSIGGEVGWTNFSDGRFKIDIKEDVFGLEFIKQLRPITYTVDKKSRNAFLGVKEDTTFNPSGILENPLRHSGFVAQEVEAVAKKIGFSFSGVDSPENEKGTYGLRYAEFVVPLVKAVQELSAKVEEQQKTINALLIKDDSSSRTESNSQGAILYDTSPNPFLNDTEIKMKLPETVHQASLIVYNLEGHQLKSFLVNSRGETFIKISSHDLPGAGMYLYALIVDGKVIDTKRMILTE